MSIDMKKLHKKIFERMKTEVPKSRAHLGGYHTGKRDAYLNVIADLLSGEFDYVPTRPSKAATETLPFEPTKEELEAEA